MGMTKEERAEYMKKYRKEHREELNANRRYYYKRNKEKIKEQNKPSNRVYRESHREELKAYSKAYYASHKDDPEFKKKAYESEKRSIEKNREKWNAYYREYRKRKALEGQI